MALAVDASIPRFAGAPANNVDITSASFTPAAGAILVATIQGDSVGGNTGVIVLAVSGGGLTWTERTHRDHSEASSQESFVSQWTATVGASAAMTISVRATTRAAGSTNQISCKPYIVTGQDASPIGAVGEGSTTTNNTTPTTLTTTAANSLVFVSHCNWNAGAGATVSSDGTEDSVDYVTSIAVMSAYELAATAAAQTMNMDCGGTAAVAVNWCALEIKAGAGSTAFTTSLTGAVTPSGSVARRPAKPFAAAATTTGALARQAQKPLTGSATTSGALTRRPAKALTGAATAAGALARAAAKPLTAAATLAGTLTRKGVKAFAGTAATSGALGAVKVLLLALAGSVAPSGALARQGRKALAGTAAASGALARAAGKVLSGAASPAGSLTRKALKAFTGSAAPSGSLSRLKVVLLSLAGSVAAAGALTRRTGKSLAGTASAAGSLSRGVAKGLTGALTASGSLARRAAKSFSASVAAAGSLAATPTQGQPQGQPSAAVLLLILQSGYYRP